jgi:hypothetical protein
MSPFYKPIVKKNRHTIKEVFKNCDALQETDFCKKFFTLENCKNLFNLLEIELQSQISEISFENPIIVGKNTKRADILIYFENGEIFYIEVMSTANYGRWDQEHFEQTLLKRAQLSLDNLDLTTIMVSFGEFDSCFIDSICKMENTFGVELFFYNDEYDAKLVCSDKKKQQKNKTNENMFEFWSFVQPKVPYFEKLNPPKGSPWMGPQKTLKSVQREGSLCLHTSSTSETLNTYLCFKKDAISTFQVLSEDCDRIESEYGVKFCANRKEPLIKITHTRPVLKDKALWSEGVEFINNSNETLNNLLMNEIDFQF